MGALPKRKVTRRQRGHRRQHQALVAPQLIRCDHCGNPRRPHRACLYCGHINGRQVLTLGKNSEAE